MATLLGTAGGFGLELGRPEHDSFPPDALPKGLLPLVGVGAVWLWLRLTAS
ncbi:MAG TPA: hypothetical protein VFR38_15130 [Gaiellaceae bacterium]|nr:hypothetical protein [Gaiellaceae bacterium]